MSRGHDDYLDYDKDDFDGTPVWDPVDSFDVPDEFDDLGLGEELFSSAPFDEGATEPPAAPDPIPKTPPAFTRRPVVDPPAPRNLEHERPAPAVKEPVAPAPAPPEHAAPAPPAPAAQEPPAPAPPAPAPSEPVAPAPAAPAPAAPATPSAPVTTSRPTTQRASTTQTMTRMHRPRRSKDRKAKVTLTKRIARSWPFILAAIVLIAAISAVVVAYRTAFVGTTLAGTSTQIEVEGRLGAAPVVHLKGQLPFTYSKSKVIIKGDGRTVGSNSDVVLQISTFDGLTGKFKGGKPQLIIGRANTAAMDRSMIEAISGQKEGSRILVRRPISVNGRQRMEINVIDILPSIASGKTVDMPADAPVTIDNNPQAPKVLSHSDDKPTAPKIYTVIEGQGEQIGHDAVIVAQYGVWNWETDKVSDYTWGEQGPTPIALEKSYAGLKDSLTDQKIGSRCVIVVPSDQASGDHAVILIVDILGVLDTSK